MVGADRPSRVGRIYWAMAAYLGGFVILIGLLVRYFILPGLAVLNDPATSEAQRNRLGAVAALLMVLVLILLLVGLVLVFRVRRYFHEHSSRRQQTVCVDAWAESANRVPAQDGEDDQA